MVEAKLTKAQRAVLDRMSEGDEIWSVRSRTFGLFWHRNPADRAPRQATMFALMRAGLLEPYHEHCTGDKYRITDAGRRALEDNER